MKACLRVAADREQTVAHQSQQLSLPSKLNNHRVPVDAGFTQMQGVANRDIKLENTLLDGSPRPLIKICDFGYSKVSQGCTAMSGPACAHCGQMLHAAVMPTQRGSCAPYVQDTRP